MEKAVYIILVLCGILSQGICSVSEENNEKSSDLLTRQKRMIGGSARTLQESPYLINVVNNGHAICAATLLTINVAISAAACFIQSNTRNMWLLSKSIEGSKYHTILKVSYLNRNYNPARPTIGNLALVIFTSPINFHESINRPVTIYSGNLTTDHSPNHVVSWGRTFLAGGGRIPGDEIESFTATLLSYEVCHHIYPNVARNGNICVEGENRREHGEIEKDIGAPLIKSDQLLGIFVYHGGSRPSNPSVFMNLLDHEIRRWIHQIVPSLRLF